MDHKALLILKGEEDYKFSFNLIYKDFINKFNKDLKDEESQTQLIQSFINDPSFKLIYLDSYIKFIPLYKFETLSFNPIIQLLNDSQSNKLINGIDHTPLKISPNGLVNHVSSYSNFSIFGTRSPSTDLVELIDKYTDDDSIDIYMNITTKESYQCFYILYDNNKNCFKLISLINLLSPLPKLYLNIERISILASNDHTFLIGHTYFTIKFNNYFSSIDNLDSMLSECSSLKCTTEISVDVLNDSKIPKKQFNVDRNKKIITIGSSKQCDLCISDDSSISKVHCMLTFNVITSLWEVSDGNNDKRSTNGTWYLLNKTPIDIVKESQFRLYGKSFTIRYV